MIVRKIRLIKCNRPQVSSRPQKVAICTSVANGTCSKRVQPKCALVTRRVLLHWWHLHPAFSQRGKQKGHTRHRGHPGFLCGHCRMQFTQCADIFLFLKRMPVTQCRRQQTLSSPWHKVEGKNRPAELTITTKTPKQLEPKWLRKWSLCIAEMDASTDGWTEHIYAHSTWGIALLTSM